MSDDPALESPPAAAIAAAMPRVGRDARPIFRELSSPATQPADLELSVSIELGRVRMSLADVMQLSPGSVLELDKLAGDPVDVIINDQLVARGEVVVVDQKFAVRIVAVTSENRSRE